MSEIDVSIYDMVPIKNPTIYWEMTSGGRIRLEITEGGFVSTCKRLFTGKPLINQVVLDKFGSYIWTKMDGKHTIEEIGTLLYQKFGDEVEPLEERLEGHIAALKRHRLIVY